MAQDKVEVFGGYQYLHTGTITIDGQSEPNSSQGFNGWDASLRGNLSKYLGVEGDFGGTYATINSNVEGFSTSVSDHVYTYTGGPVVSAHMGLIKPFAHALFGGIRLSESESGVSISQNGFTMMIGGGVDAKINKMFAVRLIDADWVYYHFGSKTVADVTIPSFSQSNNVRITTGIVVRF
jgi:hypothetical protein